jgi:hypothetical protein
VVSYRTKNHSALLRLVDPFPHVSVSHVALGILAQQVWQVGACHFAGSGINDGH